MYIYIYRIPKKSSQYLHRLSQGTQGAAHLQPFLQQGFGPWQGLQRAWPCHGPDRLVT